jgi:hypothetical protein
MELETTIRDYHVTLNTDMDGEGVTGCWIDHKESGTSASLAAAQGEGVLTPYRGNGPDHPISQDVVDRVAKWAEANGY